MKNQSSSIKFFQKILVLAIILIFIILSIIIFTSTIREPDNYIIKSKTFGDLSYSGETLKDKPYGNATIKNNDGSFYMKGLFEDGSFKSGYISINNPGVAIYMDGIFNNFLLQEGMLTITTETEKIEKNGTFIDNKLNGIGNIKITDIETGELKFVYAGKFKNDSPVYK